MTHHYKRTHSHRQTHIHTLTHSLTDSLTYTHILTHGDTCIKSMNMFSWGIFGAVWKCRGGGQELPAEVIRAPGWGSWNPLFDQSFYFKHISLFWSSERSIFPLVPSFSLQHQRFFMQKWGNFEPLYLNNESRFLKIKKVLLIQGLRNVSQKFQPSAVNRKSRKGQAEQLILSILFAEVG